MLYVTCQYGDINTSVKSGEMVLTLYRLCWHYIDFQFLSQSLVKAKCTRLRGRIVHIPGMDQETGHAGNGDNMTMVALDHCWKEFLGKKECETVFTSKTRRISTSISSKVVLLAPIPALLIKTVGSPQALWIFSATSPIFTEEVISVS